MFEGGPLSFYTMEAFKSIGVHGRPYCFESLLKGGQVTSGHN